MTLHLSDHGKLCENCLRIDLCYNAGDNTFICRECFYRQSYREMNPEPIVHEQNLSLFDGPPLIERDLEKGTELGEKAMNRAAYAAPMEWMDAAHDAVTECAKHYARFISDEFHEMHKRLCFERGIDYSASNRSAVGYVLQAAAKDGVIRNTGEYRPSARPTAHAKPSRVWESLIFFGGERKEWQ